MLGPPQTARIPCTPWFCESFTLLSLSRAFPVPVCLYRSVNFTRGFTNFDRTTDRCRRHKPDRPTAFVWVLSFKPCIAILPPTFSSYSEPSAWPSRAPDKLDLVEHPKWWLYISESLRCYVNYKLEKLSKKYSPWPITDVSTDGLSPLFRQSLASITRRHHSLTSDGTSKIINFYIQKKFHPKSFFNLIAIWNKRYHCKKSKTFSAHPSFTLRPSQQVPVAPNKFLIKLTVADRQSTLINK